MKSLVTRIKPKSGFSKVVHIGLVALMPPLMFVLVRLSFAPVALVILLLSKWRMFAVRPRFWLANMRANAVDIMVGVSALSFMTQTQSYLWQALWAVLYAVWLIGIKPGSSVVFVSVQAMIAFVASLMALFTAYGDAPLSVLVSAAGLICYLVAHHFLDSFDEPYAKFLAYMWGFIGASLTWVLGHWLLYYGVLSQPTLLLLTLGYGLMGLYYFDHHDRLSRILKMEFVFIMVAIAVINILALLISTRGSKII